MMDIFNNNKKFKFEKKKCIIFKSINNILNTDFICNNRIRKLAKSYE